MKIRYVCIRCGALKTIMAHPLQTREQLIQELPKFLVCGVMGCGNYAKREDLLNGTDGASERRDTPPG